MDEREESVVFYQEGILDIHTERPVGRIITPEEKLRVHKYLEEKYKKMLEKHGFEPVSEHDREIAWRRAGYTKPNWRIENEEREALKNKE